MTNCPNCGAPLTSHKCEYCGAIVFDFAAIEIGKPGRGYMDGYKDAMEEYKKKEVTE